MRHMLVCGASAMDFGPEKRASTLTGIINGSGSEGQIIGVTLPGWEEELVGKSWASAVARRNPQVAGVCSLGRS